MIAILREPEHGAGAQPDDVIEAATPLVTSASTGSTKRSPAPPGGPDRRAAPRPTSLAGVTAVKRRCSPRTSSASVSTSSSSLAPHPRGDRLAHTRYIAWQSRMSGLGGARLGRVQPRRVDDVRPCVETSQGSARLRQWGSNLQERGSEEREDDHRERDDDEDDPVDARVVLDLALRSTNVASRIGTAPLRPPHHEQALAPPEPRGGGEAARRPAAATRASSTASRIPSRQTFSRRGEVDRARGRRND